MTNDTANRERADKRLLNDRDDPYGGQSSIDDYMARERAKGAGGAAALRMYRVHDLDCWPDMYHAILEDAKKAEVRRNDRGFMVGDFLRLNRLRHNARGAARDPHLDPLYVCITHILQGGQFGIEAGYCVMSIEYVQMGDCGIAAVLREWAA